jgi:hypothetical protein
LPTHPAPAFRQKLSDAFLRSVTAPGKYADGEVPGVYLQVQTWLKEGAVFG